MPSSPREPTPRFRHGLHLSTPSPAGFSSQLTSPSSAISAISMSSPHHQALHTTGSAILPYDPREWAPSPAQGSERHFFAVERAMPSRSSPLTLPPPPPPPLQPPLLPPPYTSPPSTQSRSANSSMDSDRAPSTHLQSRFSTQPHWPSPESQSHRPYPPPPGPSGRGASRERLFGIPMGRRREREQLASSPEPVTAGGALAPHPCHQAATERPTSHAVPPASRRAVSTGAIDTQHSARSRSISQTRWGPGMPVPPPPPPPPRPAPPACRSQSVQCMERNAVPLIFPPVRRQPPCGVSSLGPVPPTPADWDENDGQAARPVDCVQASPLPKPSPPAKCDPGLTLDVAPAAVEPPRGSSSAGGLHRTAAPHQDKTIMQRRSEGRSQHHDVAGSIGALMADIVVLTKGNSVAPAASLPRTRPHSAGKGHEPWPATGDSARFDSCSSTPQAPRSAKMKGRAVETPPFSPSAAILHGQSGGGPHGMSPKALPTPPLMLAPGSAGLPLSREAVMAQTASDFAAGTTERFRAFSTMESTAATDAERVRLFADFVVSESRIRRERYATAIGAMGSEMFDLTRDLFRPMSKSRSGSAASQGSWVPEASQGPFTALTPRGDRGGDRGEGSSSSASSAKFSSSPGQAAGTRGTLGYMPSLSPIPSMSVSDNLENGSRGRPPSRWWEAKAGDGFEWSKRDFKYMGVPKDQWLEGDCASSSPYPTEKTDWHEQEASPTPQTPQTPAGIPCSPAMSRPRLLDVSRLVTLPPPYPRHHPAVNNNHPELSSIRSSVRALSRLDEVDGTKERFAAASARRCLDFAKETSDGRQAMRASLQEQIQSGHLNYSEAAVIEADFNAQEEDKKKELEKTEYEHFQNEVVLPLNSILTDRISRATELFDDLTRHLFDASEMTADMPQSEGDDRPELLEKLTLVKWVFEQRETLHRAVYDLVSDRNDRYCDVVLAPYRSPGKAEKLESAKDFFAADAAKREHSFAADAMSRVQRFRAVMEDAVARGAELQLSAFWDIAPPLRRLVEAIPADLTGFGIQIPAKERVENPAYAEHPLQYLYSLLLHAEKSSYQFIEAHTNQLCLLHEVREAEVNARARTMDGDDGEEMREREGRRLTEDLKDKVRVVQEQWRGALGEVLGGVRERTGEWLLSTGGWDEAFEDGGVGVA